MQTSVLEMGPRRELCRDVLEFLLCSQYITNSQLPERLWAVELKEALSAPKLDTCMVRNSIGVFGSWVKQGRYTVDAYIFLPDASTLKIGQNH